MYRQPYAPFVKLCQSEYPGNCVICGDPLSAGSDYVKFSFNYGVLDRSHRASIPVRLDKKKGLCCLKCQIEITVKYSTVNTQDANAAPKA